MAGTAFCALPGHAAHPATTEIETVSKSERLEVINSILSHYSAWNNATFNGKIISDKLPVKPGVRIYAERDRLLEISLRAPLLGEVGRIRITPEEILLVNKWKKTYVRESASDASSLYPGILGDIQSLLLGRIVILGSGELSLKNFNEVECVAANDGWVIVPPSLGALGVGYGYVVAENGRTSALYGGMRGRNESLLLEYSYPGSSIDIGILWKAKKEFRATLSFSSVRWGGEPMGEVNVSKYTRMSIREFIKNIR